MKKSLFTTLLVTVFASLTGLMAQPSGTTDPSFGDGGKVIIDNGFTDLFTDVEIQEDQNIVAIGISYDAMFSAIAHVYRFLSDGSPDVDFANNGMFSFSLDNEANVFDCLIKPDGKILIAGSTTNYSVYRILLLQLNADGSFDNAFGDNGVVAQKIGPDIDFYEDHGYAIALQDDKIIVAGKSYNEDYLFEPFVARFNENGELDTSFGTDGVARIPVNFAENDFDGLLVQEDGKIVASGHIALDFTLFAMLVARFDADGSPDATFGDNGTFIQANEADAEGFDISLTKDNDIVVAGFTASPSYNYSMLLMQLDPTGVLDPDFGNGGLVISDLGQYDVGNALHIQGDGKILVAGATGDGPPGDAKMAVWRYNPNGTPDPDFGTGGIAEIQLTDQVDEALGMTLQDDGKIIIAGKSRNANFDYAVVRLFNDVQTSTPEWTAPANTSLSPNPLALTGTLLVSYELKNPSAVQVDFYTSSGIHAGVVNLGIKEAGLQNSYLAIPESIGQGIYFVKIHADGYAGNALKLIITD